MAARNEHTRRLPEVVLTGKADGEKAARSASAAARAATVLSPSMLGASLLLLLSECMDTATLTCAIAVSVVCACALGAFTSAPAARGKKRPVLAALACLAVVALGATLLLPDARAGFFALANGVIDHFDDAYGAYAPFISGSTTCASSPVFGACLGAAAATLSWLVAGLGAPALTMAVAVLAAVMSVRLGLGAAAAGCVLGIGAWIARCRVAQVPGSTYSMRSLVVNTCVSALSCIALFAAVSLPYSPLKAFDDAHRAVDAAYEEIRFGHDTLPQGDLSAAAAMNDDSGETGLTVSCEGRVASDLYLRGFTGADFDGLAWTPLSHEAYEGDWRGMGTWLGERGLTPSLQRSAFDDLAVREGASGGTGSSTITVDASRANRRYVYVPYTLRKLSGVDLRGRLEGSLASGLLPSGSYRETIDDVQNEDILAATDWLATSEAPYAEAERVYAAFVEANYLQVGDAESAAADELIFNEALWGKAADGAPDDADAGAVATSEPVSDYAVIARVRTMLSTLAGYTTQPAAAGTADGSFLRWFLTGAREGNSSYFATAAVLAFRSQGLPARYVEGYRAGASELAAAAGSELSLSAKSAHAWAEVYLDGIGWTPVEVTPGFYTQAIEADELINVGQAWSSGGGDVLGEAADGSELDETDKDDKPRDDRGLNPGPLVAFLAFAGAALLAVCLLAAGQRQARASRRKHTTAALDQEICVPALYAYLTNVMEERGIGFDEDRPLDCLGDFEGAFAGVDTKEYQRVIELYQAFTFGGRDLRANELRTLRRFNERLHAALPKPKNLLDLLRRRFVRAL